MKTRIKFNKSLEILSKILSILFIILVLSSIILTSCVNKEEGEEAGQKSQIVAESKGDIIIELDNTNYTPQQIIVLDGDKEIILVGEEPGEEEQEAAEEQEQEETEEATESKRDSELLTESKATEQSTTARISEVEFYFLLTGKSYFQHILGENQARTYNMSGYLVTIEPIIITQDSVKFKINDFITKELEEDDSDATQEFEIIVKDIYYRP